MLAGRNRARKQSRPSEVAGCGLRIESTVARWANGGYDAEWIARRSISLPLVVVVVVLVADEFLALRAELATKILPFGGRLGYATLRYDTFVETDAASMISGLFAKLLSLVAITSEMGRDARPASKVSAGLASVAKSLA